MFLRSSLSTQTQNKILNSDLIKYQKETQAKLLIKI